MSEELYEPSKSLEESDAKDTDQREVMSVDEKYQQALLCLKIDNPFRFGGMYCTLDLRVRHGVFGLWEREYSGYDGPSYCLVKKMSLSDGYSLHLKHPVIRFADDDAKGRAIMETASLAPSPPPAESRGNQ